MTDLPTHALTLRNPWPWLMFHVPRDHRKAVENRSRNLGFHREFWMHTSKGSARDDWTAAAATAANAGVPIALHPTADGVLEKLPCGHIVARVVCAGTVQGRSGIKAPQGFRHADSKLTGEQVLAFLRDRWFFGGFGYVIESFELVTPVPCRGYQGFWRVPANVLEQLRSAA